MKNVLTGFNKFFISVGLKLAEEINDPQPKEVGDIEDCRDVIHSSI